MPEALQAGQSAFLICSQVSFFPLQSFSVAQDPLGEQQDAASFISQTLFLQEFACDFSPATAERVRAERVIRMINFFILFSLLSVKYYFNGRVWSSLFTGCLEEE